MKRLTIEWRHYERAGETCDRCSETGTALRGVIRALETECEGLDVAFLERRLSDEAIDDSNALLFNGVPIEAVLRDARAGRSPCTSCGELIGAQVTCRTLEHGDVRYDALPAALIREAACRVAGCC
jgi:hypothetical protein